MRICIFTPNFLPAVGGTEFVTDRLARQFHAAGHRVVVLAQGKPTALDVPYPVCWFGLPIFRRWFPERVACHLAGLHQREHFDVILCHYAHPTGYAALRVSARAQVPVVVVSHGGDLYRHSKDRRRRHLWKRTVHTYRQAHGLVAISPYLEELIRELNPAPRLLERIPNGIDVEELAGPAERPADFPGQTPFCLCLGNLGPLKGFDDALTAYARSRRQLGDLGMVVVGSGPSEADLRRQARDLGIADHVRFLGKRTGNDKRWLMRNCLFGVMPSLEEGHPIVGLEFLAVGKPVVCTTNPAFDEMYQEGVNALRVPARQPELLADALVRMRAADLTAMAELCRQRAQTFAWPAIAQRYLDFMERVIADYRAAAASGAINTGAGRSMN